MSSKHALVIGGTGMLADVSLWLVETGYQVSIIGRTMEKHRKLVDKASKPEFITSLAVDYSNYLLLEEQVRKTVEENGPISLVVSWSPIRTLEIINQVLSEQKDSWELYQIKGSRRFFDNEPPLSDSSCQQRSIYLGFTMEGNQSRWLTHNEISQGVITNIKEGNTESIIGILHPYDQRPS
ncbi:hypothetical protein [Paenisporosarcina sp. TG20]|uniref:hypothetical protein n=1 Tax=Paenisporosarcina sp. TG20 TaxID=1211706 RepID=UPI0002F6A159|nr:hypothetical protein [Paenisporosarcina sp. TG20]